MSHQNNRLLIDKIIERTVLILKDSYGSVAVEDAFQMAIGEAEVHFNEDIKLKLTPEIGQSIKLKLK
ncbi:hypothetical protein PghCCS26_46160 [Paenibacillus glycanilyticus]|uniref:Uncharacterized protein n=1 Tax=Paenibacillus glycanilyticus TaxID=126569 RepID=A0ABQ6NQX4_9BACL|nr:hypothetical protein [Paenibacillus glycanilyticus]GMK47486.1 hypothetical protein PghCCS26_46160 [Paenibacillus glycanilyticus]